MHRPTDHRCEQKRDEQDYYVHAYELALGSKKQAADALAAGKGVRETARETGLSVGTVSALKQSVQKSPELNTPPHDADGVITEHAPVQTNNAPEMTPVAEQTPVAVPAGEVEGTGDVTTPQPDDLAIPSYLDRRQQVSA